MKKRLVHIITGLHDGGAEAVLFRLCLNSSQYTHVVVSLMDHGKYGSLLEEAGVRVFCVGMRPGIPSIAKFLKLVRFLRSESPFAVQTWMYHADLLGGVAAKLAGVKRIFWGIRHSTLERGKAKKSTVLIARLCAKLSQFIPEKIICCAHKALEVHRDIGYSVNKLVVIPNGYELSRFTRDDHVGKALRAKFNISSDTFLIGKVGRYHAFKDHRNLLCALAKIDSPRLNIKCLLVGKGLSSNNKELVEIIESLGLSGCVILAGQRTDIPTVMNAIDLHVLSSSSEGFPNVLAEAMACGTPAVATNVGDAGEIIGNPECLCTPGDAESLSRLIVAAYYEWLDKPHTWTERRERCVQHIKNNFSIERMVADYEDRWCGR